MNIRAYDATSQDVLRKAGAQAQNISFADAMPRIASGEVNAVLSSGDGGAGKLWEHLPHFAEINYAMPVSVATMNLQAYQSLDARAHRAIDQAAAQTEERAMETHRRPAAAELRQHAQERRDHQYQGAGVRAQGVEKTRRRNP